MDRWMKRLAVGALGKRAALAAMAQTDQAVRSCGTLMDRKDGAARLETAHVVVRGIVEVANFAAAGRLDRGKMVPVQDSTTTQADARAANRGLTG